VILADADLDLAVESTVQGAFGSTGQRCTATSRAVVDKSIANEFVERLHARAASLVVGNGLDPKTNVGPSVDDKQLETVLEYVGIGRSEGAKLVSGGDRLSDSGRDRGFFVAPTIFDHVNANMRVAQEEIFGPVLSVIRADDVDAARNDVFARRIDRGVGLVAIGRQVLSDGGDHTVVAVDVGNIVVRRRDDSPVLNQ
jgi:aldehyde dehydrogenase (NAD+)